jgi:hypothetical protein
VLYPGVHLHQCASKVGRSPIITNASRLCKVAIDVRHIIRLHQNLQCEPRAGVPCDMAVQQPGTRVVRPKGHGEEPAPHHERGVATRRVLEVEEARARRLVPGLVALRQDYEIAAVEMDRVRSFRVLVNK